MTDFESLVDDHYQGLFRFALSLTRNSDWACDLVQETFCIWANKGDQLRDPTKAKSWLYTTLHREYLHQHRNQSRFTPTDPYDTPVEPSACPILEPDRQLDGQRAISLLNQLDEIYRSPLTLFYLQQHSYREIAEILDLPMGTVMSRLSRGKEMLRKAMMEDDTTNIPHNLIPIQHPNQRHG